MKRWLEEYVGRTQVYVQHNVVFVHQELVRCASRVSTLGVPFWYADFGPWADLGFSVMVLGPNRVMGT